MRTITKIGLAVIGATVAVVGLSAQTRQAGNRPEVRLLGVRVLTTSASEVLRLFGNPTTVSNTQVTISEFTGQGQQQGAPTGFGDGRGEAGPRGPAGGPPGFGGDFGGGAGGTGETRVENEMVYIYRGKGGSVYAFQFNKDGRLVQVSAYGRRPDPKVRTSRGIGFNSTYAQVIRAYGYPTEHAMLGDVYVVRYNRLGIAFQFEAKTNRVTGIFVAAGIPTVGAGFTGLGGQQQQPGGFGGPAGGPPGRGGPPAPGGMPGGRGGGGGAAAAPQI
ncbi:MAG: hypothetical protein SNJ72_00985 [Fimbriimonadales bacterium]